MKLRKLVSVAMAGVMTLSLAACGGSGTADTTAAPASTEAAADTTAADAGETEAKEAAPAGGVAKEDLKVGFVFIGDENEGYTAAHYKGAMEMKEAMTRLSLNGTSRRMRLLRMRPWIWLTRDARLYLQTALGMSPM